MNEYEFPGDDTPIIKGSALNALNSPSDESANKCVVELMEACDSFIPEPERDVDKPFLMPVEDVFSITGRGTVGTGRIERGIIKVGDEISILGMGADSKTTVTGVEMFGVLLSWFPMLLLIAVWIFFMRQMQGGKGGAMGFGKSKAKMMNELKGKVTLFLFSVKSFAFDLPKPIAPPLPPCICLIKKIHTPISNNIGNHEISTPSSEG